VPWLTRFVPAPWVHPVLELRCNGCFSPFAPHGARPPVKPDRDEDAEPSGSPAVYESLAAATPEGRRAIVLGHLRERPAGRLVLPERDGRGAVLDGIDLAGAGDVTLRDADLRGARLRGAILRGLDFRGACLAGAALGGADLRRAALENADLRAADLASADLRRAGLGEADLRGAMLEEADLRGANLRFADLRDAALEGADLRRADLWGANLDGASLAKADLRGATLKEASLRSADLSAARLRGAALGRADCGGATFAEADLRGAAIDGVDLRGASLRGARLQGLDLTRSAIANVRLSGAWLGRTRLGQEQLGGVIGEELAGEFDEARKGYLALERCFRDLGDPDAASWAYRRKRRMQKREAARRARAAAADRDWRAAAGAAFDFASDQLVEWICDYGESIARIGGAMAVLLLSFALVYGVAGSVVRVARTPAGEVRTPTRDPADLAAFSLMALTSGNFASDLEPADRLARLFSGAEATLGIALTGLLGFVAGNLVRR